MTNLIPIKTRAKLATTRNEGKIRQLTNILVTRDTDDITIDRGVLEEVVRLLRTSNNVLDGQAEALDKIEEAYVDLQDLFDSK